MTSLQGDAGNDMIFSGLSRAAFRLRRNGSPSDHAARSGVAMAMAAVPVCPAIRLTPERTGAPS